MVGTRADTRTDPNSPPGNLLGGLHTKDPPTWSLGQSLCREGNVEEEGVVVEGRPTCSRGRRGLETSPMFSVTTATSWVTWQGAAHGAASRETPLPRLEGATARAWQEEAPQTEKEEEKTRRLSSWRTT